jgi:hypothetical protein
VPTTATKVIGTMTSVGEKGAISGKGVGRILVLVIGFISGKFPYRLHQLCKDYYLFHHCCCLCNYSRSSNYQF